MKSLFDKCEQDLLELGFVEVDPKGKMVIPVEQLAKIVNIDETCPVVDGSKCNRGGRSKIIFCSPNLPNLGKAIIKTSAATTMITGSTVAGEPMLLHFQFSTTGQSNNM